MPPDADPTPLSPEQIVLAVVNVLTPWAQERRAAVSVARDPYEVLELLGATGPTGLRLVVHWAGDDNLGDQPEAPLTTQSIEVVLGLPLGLTARPDAALVAGSATRPSLLALVGSLRARVLALAFPDEVTGIHFGYNGAKPVVTPEGMALAAYTLRFTLDAALGTEDADRSADFSLPVNFAGSLPG